MTSHSKRRLGPGGGGGKGEESTWQGTSGDRCLELGTLQHIAQDRWSVNVQEVGREVIRKDSFFFRVFKK